MLGCSLLPTTIYNYIILSVFVGSRRVEGRRYRHHVGSDYLTSCFPSAPGRLVQVLRALVGYRHDGDTFEARYEEVYHKNVIFQGIFRQDMREKICEELGKRVNRYIQGKAHPKQDEKRASHILLVPMSSIGGHH